MKPEENQRDVITRRRPTVHWNPNDDLKMTTLDHIIVKPKESIVANTPHCSSTTVRYGESPGELRKIHNLDSLLPMKHCESSFRTELSKDHIPVICKFRPESVKTESSSPTVRSHWCPGEAAAISNLNTYTAVKPLGTDLTVSPENCSPQNPMNMNVNCPVNVNSNLILPVVDSKWGLRASGGGKSPVSLENNVKEPITESPAIVCCPILDMLYTNLSEDRMASKTKTQDPLEVERYGRPPEVQPEEGPKAHLPWETPVAVKSQQYLKHNMQNSNMYHHAVVNPHSSSIMLIGAPQEDLNNLNMDISWAMRPGEILARTEAHWRSVEALSQTDTPAVKCEHSDPKVTPEKGHVTIRPFVNPENNVMKSSLDISAGVRFHGSPTEIRTEAQPKEARTQRCAVTNEEYHTQEFMRETNPVAIETQKLPIDLRYHWSPKDDTESLKLQSTISNRFQGNPVDVQPLTNDLPVGQCETPVSIRSCNGPTAVTPHDCPVAMPHEEDTGEDLRSSDWDNHVKYPMNLLGVESQRCSLNQSLEESLSISRYPEIPEDNLQQPNFIWPTDSWIHGNPIAVRPGVSSGNDLEHLELHSPADIQSQGSSVRFRTIINNSQFRTRESPVTISSCNSLTTVKHEDIFDDDLNYPNQDNLVVMRPCGNPVGISPQGNSTADRPRGKAVNVAPVRSSIEHLNIKENLQRNPSEVSCAEGFATVDPEENLSKSKVHSPMDVRQLDCPVKVKTEGSNVVVNRLDDIEKYYGVIRMRLNGHHEAIRCHDIAVQVNPLEGECQNNDAIIIPTESAVDEQLSQVRLNGNDAEFKPQGTVLVTTAGNPEEDPKAAINVSITIILPSKKTAEENCLKVQPQENLMENPTPNLLSKPARISGNLISVNPCVSPTDLRPMSNPLALDSHESSMSVPHVKGYGEGLLMNTQENPEAVGLCGSPIKVQPQQSMAVNNSREGQTSNLIKSGAGTLDASFLEASSERGMTIFRCQECTEEDLEKPNLANAEAVCIDKNNLSVRPKEATKNEQSQTSAEVNQEKCPIAVRAQKNHLATASPMCHGTHSMNSNLDTPLAVTSQVSDVAVAVEDSGGELKSNIDDLLADSHQRVVNKDTCNKGTVECQQKLNLNRSGASSYQRGLLEVNTAVASHGNSEEDLNIMVRFYHNRPKFKPQVVIKPKSSAVASKHQKSTFKANSVESVTTVRSHWNSLHQINNSNIYSVIEDNQDKIPAVEELQENVTSGYDSHTSNLSQPVDIRLNQSHTGVKLKDVPVGDIPQVSDAEDRHYGNPTTFELQKHLLTFKPEDKAGSSSEDPSGLESQGSLSEVSVQWSSDKELSKSNLKSFATVSHQGSDTTTTTGNTSRDLKKSSVTNLIDSTPQENTDLRKPNLSNPLERQYRGRRLEAGSEESLTIVRSDGNPETQLNNSNVYGIEEAQLDDLSIKTEFQENSIETMSGDDSDFSDPKSSEGINPNENQVGINPKHVSVGNMPQWSYMDVRHSESPATFMPQESPMELKSDGGTSSGRPAEAAVERSLSAGTARWSSDEELKQSKLNSLAAGNDEVTIVTVMSEGTARDNLMGSNAASSINVTSKQNTDLTELKLNSPTSRNYPGSSSQVNDKEDRYHGYTEQQLNSSIIPGTVVRREDIPVIEKPQGNSTDVTSGDDSIMLNGNGLVDVSHNQSHTQVKLRHVPAGDTSQVSHREVRHHENPNVLKSQQGSFPGRSEDSAKTDSLPESPSVLDSQSGLGIISAQWNIDENLKKRYLKNLIAGSLQGNVAIMRPESSPRLERRTSNINNPIEATPEESADTIRQNINILAVEKHQGSSLKIKTDDSRSQISSLGNSRQQLNNTDIQGPVEVRHDISVGGKHQENLTSGHDSDIFGQTVPEDVKVNQNHKGLKPKHDHMGNTPQKSYIDVRLNRNSIKQMPQKSPRAFKSNDSPQSETPFGSPAAIASEESLASGVPQRSLDEELKKSHQNNLRAVSQLQRGGTITPESTAGEDVRPPKLATSTNVTPNKRNNLEELDLNSSAAGKYQASPWKVGSEDGRRSRGSFGQQLGNLNIDNILEFRRHDSAIEESQGNLFKVIYREDSEMSISGIPQVISLKSSHAAISLVQLSIFRTPQRSHIDVSSKEDPAEFMPPGIPSVQKLDNLNIQRRVEVSRNEIATKAKPEENPINVTSVDDSQLTILNHYINVSFPQTHKGIKRKYVPVPGTSQMSQVEVKQHGSPTDINHHLGPAADQPEGNPKPSSPPGSPSEPVSQSSFDTISAQWSSDEEIKKSNLKRHTEGKLQGSADPISSEISPTEDLRTSNLGSTTEVTPMRITDLRRLSINSLGGGKHQGSSLRVNSEERLTTVRSRRNSGQQRKRSIREEAKQENISIAVNPQENLIEAMTGDDSDALGLSNLKDISLKASYADISLTHSFVGSTIQGSYIDVRLNRSPTKRVPQESPMVLKLEVSPQSETPFGSPAAIASEESPASGVPQRSLEEELKKSHQNNLRAVSQLQRGVTITPESTAGEDVRPPKLATSTNATPNKTNNLEELDLNSSAAGKYQASPWKVSSEDGLRSRGSFEQQLGNLNIDDILEVRRRVSVIHKSQANLFNLIDREDSEMSILSSRDLIRLKSSHGDINLVHLSIFSTPQRSHIDVNLNADPAEFIPQESLLTFKADGSTNGGPPFWNPAANTSKSLGIETTQWSSDEERNMSNVKARLAGILQDSIVTITPERTTSDLSKLIVDSSIRSTSKDSADLRKLNLNNHVEGKYQEDPLTVNPEKHIMAARQKLNKSNLHGKVELARDIIPVVGKHQVNPVDLTSGEKSKMLNLNHPADGSLSHAHADIGFQDDPVLSPLQMSYSKGEHNGSDTMFRSQQGSAAVRSESHSKADLSPENPFGIDSLSSHGTISAQWSPKEDLKKTNLSFAEVSHRGSAIMMRPDQKRSSNVYSPAAIGPEGSKEYMGRKSFARPIRRKYRKIPLEVNPEESWTTVRAHGSTREDLINNLEEINLEGDAAEVNHEVLTLAKSPLGFSGAVRLENDSAKSYHNNPEDVKISESHAEFTSNQTPAADPPPRSHIALRHNSDPVKITLEGTAVPSRHQENTLGNIFHRDLLDVISDRTQDSAAPLFGAEASLRNSSFAIIEDEHLGKDKKKINHHGPGEVTSQRKPVAVRSKNSYLEVGPASDVVASDLSIGEVRPDFSTEQAMGELNIGEVKSNLSFGELAVEINIGESRSDWSIGEVKFDVG
ncbi:hypothetical protein scyTo_0014315 [Scyliorhinus torazame]|uniref:Uncharacterized protein n=1 Tax=Scyliorhinus torazame TaxID=75743 RepID=A0A401NK98_SCYTO|nr:hypothetical protein [Scyliorhinus torazame]